MDIVNNEWMNEWKKNDNSWIGIMLHGEDMDVQIITANNAFEQHTQSITYVPNPIQFMTIQKPSCLPYIQMRLVFFDFCLIELGRSLTRSLFYRIQFIFIQKW